MKYFKKNTLINILQSIGIFVLGFAICAFFGYKAPEEYTYALYLVGIMIACIYTSSIIFLASNRIIKAIEKLEKTINKVDKNCESEDEKEI